MFQTLAMTLLAIAIAVPPAVAQNKHDPGTTGTEIKVGNLMPYSGAFSEYGATGRAEAAYFQMINDRGGINGHKITFISLDSGPDFQRSVDLARELVEKDQVLLIVGSWGSVTNKIIRPYMNENKIPQLFVASTDSIFDDPGNFPWTMGFQPSRRTEGSAYAKYILRAKPDARIGILYPAGDDGMEYLLGLREGLGEKAQAMIVKEAPFDYADPGTINSQISVLKNSGADVFLNLTVGRFATQAIRRAYDINWRPLQFLPNASLSITAFLEPAGLAKAAGVITNARSKGWLTPQSRRDPAVREFLEWMQKYNPQANERDANNVYGYEVAETLVEVLKKCGDNLSRANVMKQATSLDVEVGMLRPGIRIQTSPTDYQPVKGLFLIQFNGKAWVPLR